MEDSEEADHISIDSPQRRPDIAFCAHLLQKLIARKKLSHTARVSAAALLDDVLTWSMGEIVGEIRRRAVVPECQRAGLRRAIFLHLTEHHPSGR